MPLAKDVHATATSASPDHGTAASGTVRSERAVPVGSERSVSPPSWESGAETHLIRLCLDLQLDAMMLTLGAASARPRRASAPAAAGTDTAGTDTAGTDTAGTDTAGTDTAGTDTAVESPPWRRWVLEDVEMVCTLAADVMTGGAALPPTLGSDLDQAVPAAAIDNLVARYESMASLLADILPPGASRPAAPYRAHAQEALARYQQRLRELHDTRLDQTPPRGVPVTVDLTDHPAVPGEWLG